MKKIIFQKTQCKTPEEKFFGEPLTEKMSRILKGEEQIGETKDIIYTPRDEGVLPKYDIRADKWDIALEAADKIQANIEARSKIQKTEDLSVKIPAPEGDNPEK